MTSSVAWVLSVLGAAGAIVIVWYLLRATFRARPAFDVPARKPWTDSDDLNVFVEATQGVAAHLTADERRCLIAICDGKRLDPNANQGALATLTNSFLIDYDQSTNTHSATAMGELVAIQGARLAIMMGNAA